MEELFIYYRCPLASADEVHAAVVRWQSSLAERHPALRCRLMRRANPRDGLLTWMETYASIDRGLNLGAGGALRSELEAGSPALAACLVGVRHLEAFVPCAW